MFKNIEIKLVREGLIPLERQLAEIKDSPQLRVAKESTEALLLEIQENSYSGPQLMHKTLCWL